MGFPGAQVITRARGEALGRLARVSEEQRLGGLSARLSSLMALLHEDLASFEGAYAEVRRTENVVQKSATHLLDLGGKRLRPLCVMLASRVGGGFDARGVDLAVAVELVHAATLLHDDVVDLGDMRRGAPAARTVYGNAASIFAGDWLLVEALRRVRRAGVPGTLDRLLDVIDTMIGAEALQLEGRGQLSLDRDAWLAIVEGKTASLFRWAMYAGAGAGGLDDEAAQALEAFGVDLGVAFQAVDDVLDLTGDAETTGKGLFADVREGKMTWPLIVTLERAPEVESDLRLIAGGTLDEEASHAASRRLLDKIRETGAIADCRQMAETRIANAVARLDELPDTEATRALATVAAAVIERRK